MRPKQGSWKISHCISLLHDDAGEIGGTVVTPSGAVIVSSEGAGGRLTILQFPYRGRMHFRRYDGKSYSERGLITLARKFSEEVARDTE